MHRDMFKIQDGVAIVEKLNSIYENDSGKKRKMKEYADQRRHSKTSQIKVGDIVLIRQPKTNIGFLRFKKFTCGL